MFVGDMSRDGAPSSPKNRDIVCVAKAKNDVRDQVRRHDEIGKSAQDDGFYMQGGVTGTGTAIGGDSFLGERNHPGGAAHFPPESTFHDALVAFHPRHIQIGCVLFSHFHHMGTLLRLCYTGF